VTRFNLNRQAGFTLSEVLIAVAIFVIAIFAILQLVNQSMQLEQAVLSMFSRPKPPNPVVAPALPSPTACSD
jgi:prepilin-type N-terminal cleavage/methylation domain-containing protein